MRLSRRLFLCTCKLICAAYFTAAAVNIASGATICTVPEDLRRALPAAPPKLVYKTLWDKGAPIEEFPLGIGHVHLAPGVDGTSDWWQRLDLPLSETPGAPPFVWIADGWLVRRDGKVEPFDSSAMVETGYEVPTFIVVARQEDGWLKIRYLAPGNGQPFAWLPPCALTGKIKLTYTPWGKWFLLEWIAPLRFRLDTPHVLRAAPGVESGRVGIVSGDYHLVPDEVRGEWMHVKVSQPSDYCSERSKESKAELREGWIRWFSEEKGPWLWYSPRGCQADTEREKK